MQINGKERGIEKFMPLLNPDLSYGVPYNNAINHVNRVLGFDDE